MKEYLVKRDGEYVLVNAADMDDIIEDGQTEDENLIRVPEGAIAATISGSTTLFWRDAEENLCYNPNNRYWFEGSSTMKQYLEYWEDSKIIWEREESKPAKKQYTSELGKLYQDVKLKRVLDNMFTDMYNYIEFEIKTGNTLPFVIKHDKLHTLPEDDRVYLEHRLSEVGCIGEFESTNSSVYVVFEFN